MKYLSLVTAVILVACSSDPEEPTFKLEVETDFIVFGTYYGFCAGKDCIQIYAIQNEKLYRQVSSTPEGDSYEELPAAKYEIVKDIAEHVPSELLQTTSTVFGCPDCSDGGGVYLRLKTDQIDHTFHIDNFKHNLPEYIHPLLDEIHTRVALLQ